MTDLLQTVDSPCQRVGRHLWIGPSPAYGGYNLNLFDTIINLYPWGDYVCPIIRAHLKVRMYDNFEIPTSSVVLPIVDFTHASRSFGEVLVHCQQGINRSALIAAAVLIRHDKVPPKEAIDRIRKARSENCLKNQVFELWLTEKVSL